MIGIRVQGFGESYRIPQPLVVDDGIAEIVILEKKHVRDNWGSAAVLTLLIAGVGLLIAGTNSWFAVIIGVFLIKGSFKELRQESKDRRLEIERLRAIRLLESKKS